MVLKASPKYEITKKKTQALKEAQKNDDVKGVYALIPSKLHKKLQLYLVQNDVTLYDWITQKVEEI